MNVSFTPHEILRVLYLVTTHPHADKTLQSHLISKLSSPICSVLEAEEDRLEEEGVRVWLDQENKRIADLKEENDKVRRNRIMPRKKV